MLTPPPPTTSPLVACECCLLAEIHRAARSTMQTRKKIACILLLFFYRFVYVYAAGVQRWCAAPYFEAFLLLARKMQSRREGGKGGSAKHLLKLKFYCFTFERGLKPMKTNGINLHLVFVIVLCQRQKCQNECATWFVSVRAGQEQIDGWKRCAEWWQSESACDGLRNGGSHRQSSAYERGKEKQFSGTFKSAVWLLPM